MIIPTLTKQEVKQLSDFVFLDVRTLAEREKKAIMPSLYIPMDEIPQRFQELPKTKKIVVYCRSGGRSSMVVEFLRKKGIDAYNLEGGIINY